MRAKEVFLTTLAIAALALPGCGQAEKSVETIREQDAAEPLTFGVPGQDAAPDPAGDLQRVAGELDEVDLDARTLTVVAAGIEQVFAFSDATQIVGAAGTQGLAAREGVPVTVHYREERDVRVAVRIELHDRVGSTDDDRPTDRSTRAGSPRAAP